MNVYVESNFVLELALLQEQHASCGELLRLCEEDRIQLVIPAYSLVEPYNILITMKPLKFVGSSLDDLRNFPDEARRAAGFGG